jgi:outer membrane protein assembly factor BamD (BamD/ComL family)
MSVSGILASSLASATPSTMQNQWQKYKTEFNQLGQDLQSGNLSAAQSDFSTLQQDAPAGAAINSTQSTSPMAQEFKQLSSDLQSGNLSGAQQDFSTIKQDYQNEQGHWGHHHHGGVQADPPKPIAQEFAQLGQALQSSNLSSAQQAYSSLLQDFSLASSNSGMTSTLGSLALPISSGVSVSA